MAEQEQVYKHTEFETYDFGNEAPPEGFDPTAEGYENAPPGWHDFECVGFQVKPTHEFFGKDLPTEKWHGPQLRPEFKVIAGPHKGKTIRDFIAAPAPGNPMPKRLANQWANFLRSLGFAPPPDRLVPPGFKIHEIIGAKCRIEVVDGNYEKADANGVLTMTKDQRPKVRMFGYKPIEGANGGSPPPSAVTGGGPLGGAKPKTTPMTPAPKTTAPSIDDL